LFFLAKIAIPYDFIFPDNYNSIVTVVAIAASTEYNVIKLSANKSVFLALYFIDTQTKAQL
jgi:hypothetical protein